MNGMSWLDYAQFFLGVGQGVTSRPVGQARSADLLESGWKIRRNYSLFLIFGEKRLAKSERTELYKGLQWLDYGIFFGPREV